MEEQNQQNQQNSKNHDSGNEYHDQNDILNYLISPSNSMTETNQRLLLQALQNSRAGLRPQQDNANVSYFHSNSVYNRNLLDAASGASLRLHFMRHYFQEENAIGRTPNVSYGQYNSHLNSIIQNSAIFENNATSFHIGNESSKQRNMLFTEAGQYANTNITVSIPVSNAVARPPAAFSKVSNITGKKKNAPIDSRVAITGEGVQVSAPLKKDQSYEKCRSKTLSVEEALEQQHGPDSMVDKLPWDSLLEESKMKKGDENLVSLLSKPAEVVKPDTSPLQVESELVSEEIRGIIPDSLFFAMAQMKKCTLQDTDKIGKYRSRMIGYRGFCCKHCGGSPGEGRYFPGSFDSFMNGSNRARILIHVAHVCTKCPDDVKEAILQCERYEGAKLPEKQKYGSRKRFFSFVWSRIHGEGGATPASEQTKRKAGSCLELDAQVANKSSLSATACPVDDVDLSSASYNDELRTLPFRKRRRT